MHLSPRPNHLFPRLNKVSELARNGRFDILRDEWSKRFHSESFSFGLRRDMNKDFKAPEAKIKLHIRPLKAGDGEQILKNSSGNPVDPRIIASQYSLLEQDMPTCFVAATTDHTPCYMQWLIGPAQNDKLEQHFKGLFPRLKKGEALLEGAYCSPDYRGQRIMPAAMAQIAEKAESINARWVKTFVDITNIPSLKGCRRSGFEPYVLRRDRWFLFRRTTSFHSIPEKLIEYYETYTGDKASRKTESDIPNLNKKELQPIIS